MVQASQKVLPVFKREVLTAELSHTHIGEHIAYFLKRYGTGGKWETVPAADVITLMTVNNGVIPYYEWFNA